MAFKVIWRELPGKRKIRDESFTHLDDARRVAALYALSVPGKVETTVYDEAGNQMDIEVRDNADRS